MPILTSADQVSSATDEELRAAYAHYTGRAVEGFASRQIAERLVEMALMSSADARGHLGVPKDSRPAPTGHAELVRLAAETGRDDPRSMVREGLPGPQAGLTLAPGTNPYPSGSLAARLWAQAAGEPAPPLPPAEEQARAVRVAARSDRRPIVSAGASGWVKATGAARAKLQATSVRAAVYAAIEQADNKTISIAALLTQFGSAARGCIAKLRITNHITDASPPPPPPPPPRPLPSPLPHQQGSRSMTTPALIVGAGLAGLIAGYAFPGVPIAEAAPRGAAPHRALLRFRTDAVSRLTGIPFRRVRVHKGVWSLGQYTDPNPQLANLYARKCLGFVSGERSIWNVEPADRWVGPETLIEQMTEALAPRIEFDLQFDFAQWGATRAPGRAVISTAPLAHALAAIDMHPAHAPVLRRAPIWTRRYRVHAADAHQTVYFPDHNLATYRASLTGDLLIVELRENLPDETMQRELTTIVRALGLHAEDVEPIDASEQRHGKILPLQDDERRGLMARLTIEAGIYSLGRFATWRNVLLDDVVHDADVVRRLLRAPNIASNFHALRAAAGA